MKSISTEFELGQKIFYLSNRIYEGMVARVIQDSNNGKAVTRYYIKVKDNLHEVVLDASHSTDHQFRYFFGSASMEGLLEKMKNEFKYRKD